MTTSNRRRIDQINDMWKADAPFSTDPLKLPEESSRTLSDLAKYRDLKTNELRRLRKMSADMEKFRFKLVRFYRDGTAKPTDQILIDAKERGWELPPGGAPTVKTDVKQWVDTNPDMVIMTLDLAEQNDIIELIDGILQDLKNRSYAINETMKQVRYNSGSNF
jgi:hypothetical protein